MALFLSDKTAIAKLLVLKPAVLKSTLIPCFASP